MLDYTLSALTPLTLTLSVLAVVLISLLVDQLRNPRAVGSKPRHDLYYPPGAYPFIGHQLRVAVMGDRQPELWVEMLNERKRAGITNPAMAHSTTILGKRFVGISRPEHLQHLQMTNFNNYAKGPEQRFAMGQIFGNGIFTSDGEHWSVQRKYTAKIFTNSSYRGVISRSISHTTDDFLSVVDHFVEKGDEINLSKLFFSYSLDTFCEMAFSSNPGALPAEKEGGSVPFAAAFDLTQVVTSRRFSNPLGPLTERLTGVHSQMKSAVGVVQSYANDLIDKREQELASKREKGDVLGEVGEAESGEADLLTSFLKMKEKEGLDKEALRDATINILIAGRDTTAGTLAWTVFHLLSQTSVLAKLVEEADSLEGRKLEFDQLKEMGYAMACWYEAARLHPSVPNNFWTALGPDQFPNGPRVEKGDLVAWSDWASARNPEVWGEDAGEYRPERWLEKGGGDEGGEGGEDGTGGKGEGKFRKESEYKMHAFNGGKRRCLGETLATFEGVSLLLSLFSRYDLAFAPDYLAATPMVNTEWCQRPTPQYQNALTLPMLKPLRVVATKRKADESS